MLTRSKAKMASSSDSMSFDINNQLGIPNNGEGNMTEYTSDVRARGLESQQREEVTLQSLMDFMRTQKEEINEKFEKQKEEINGTLTVINEKFDKQNEKFDKLNDKLDSHKEEVKQHMNEQFTLLRTEIREYRSTWNEGGSEVLKKQEEDVNKNYEDEQKVQDTDNAVDFTDVSATKKLATVGSLSLIHI